MESDRYSGDRFYNVFVPMVSEIANDFLCVIIILKDDEEEQVYVNKYGKLVFGDLLCYACYNLGPFDLSYTQEDGKYSLSHGIGSRASGNALHSQVSRWKSSSSSRKGDLQYRYEAIIFCHRKTLTDGMIRWTQTFNRHRLQPPQYELNDRSNSVYSCPYYPKSKYAPGSILLCSLQDLLSPLRVLVRSAGPWPYGWVISWQKGPSMEVVNPLFDKFVIQSTDF